VSITCFATNIRRLTSRYDDSTHLTCSVVF
jgi:hypothetical protein